MATIYEIPLSPEPQRFNISLGDTEYQLRLSYQDATEAGWLLDILNSSDSPGTPIACGLPLVTGADLLGQYEYLGIPGELWVSTDGDPDAVPTFDNLGVGGRLFFVTVP